MKTHKRAIRRHHRLRLKNKRRSQRIGFDSSEKPMELIHPLLLNTPKACSCHLCGNPRKYYKEPTYQEIRYRISDEDIKFYCAQ